MIWFNRKPKNRRIGGREHVLDVKLRSSQVRATRMRYAAVALALMFGTVFGFYLVWRTGEWALDRLIYDNNAFAIQEIDVQTDGVIAPESLRRWAGVKTGENLLALDLARVKRDVEMVSLVRSVAVERVLPHTLRLRVAEREPLAQIFVPQLRTNGGFEVTILDLDAEGYVISLLDSRQLAMPVTDTNDVLPVIAGANPNLLTPGRPADSQQVRSALKLIDAFNHSPMSGLLDLRRVDVSSPDVLEVTTSQGSQITFGLQDMDRQLRRWREIYDQGQKMTKALATLDLSVPNNIPARWVDAGTLPPSLPKIRTKPRNRRHNV